MMLPTQRYVDLKNLSNLNLVVSNYINKTLSLQDDFVEKSQNNITNVLRLMIRKSNGLCKKSNDESVTEYTSKSSAANLKIEIDSLIEQLNKTVYNSNKSTVYVISC